MIRAALKSLLGRKLRLIMSTVAIVLGVAFVTGTLIFSDTLNRSFTALFASAVGDVVVRPDTKLPSGCGSVVTIKPELVDELTKLPGAARADGNVSTCGVYVVDTKNKIMGGLGPPGLGGNWSDAPAGHGLEGLSIKEGREPSGPNEVVLDAETAEKSGYEIGDQISLITAGAQARVTPTLVGIADFADGGSLNGATLALFDTPTSQELFLDGDQAFTDIWVTARDGVSQEDLRDEVSEVLPDDAEAVTGDEAADESATELLSAISFITTFLLIFAGIALVVGAFLIVNTFSILVAQRSRELALLRALGASSKQVTRSVLFEAFVLGLLGSTLGLGLGVLLAMGIRALFTNFGLDLSGQSLVLSPSTVLAAYGVGVVVTMAAAWLPARRTSRIAPVQALRDDIALPESSLRRRFILGLVLIVIGLISLGLGLFSDFQYGGQQTGIGMLLILLGVTAVSPVISRPFLRLMRAFYAKVFGPVGNLAGQNSLRNPRRTTATASALMIGLTLACTMSIIGSSAKASVDDAVEKNFVGDFVVSNIFGGPFSPSIADEMAKVPGVAQVIRQRFQLAQVDGRDQGVGAIDPTTIEAMRLTLTQGEPTDLVADTALLQEFYAEDHDYQVGDTITVETPSGPKQWKVVGILKDNPIIFFPVVATFDTLTAAGFPAEDNALIISASGDPDQVKTALDKVVADLPIVTVKNQSEFAAEQREPIDQFVLIIYALLGLALLIAVLGIVNTLALSIIERTREVGLLRAIGMKRSQLRRMIMLESIVIAVLGALFGLLLGIGFGTGMMYAVREQGLSVIVVPWAQLVLFLLLAVIIGVVAAILPARRAARLDVLQAIATE